MEKDNTLVIINTLCVAQFIGFSILTKTFGWNAKLVLLGSAIAGILISNAARQIYMENRRKESSSPLDDETLKKL